MFSSIDFTQHLRGSESSNQTFLLQNNTSHLLEEDTFIGPSSIQLSGVNFLITMPSNLLDFNYTIGNATSFLAKIEEPDPFVICLHCSSAIVGAIIGAACFVRIEENTRNWRNNCISFYFPRNVQVEPNDLYAEVQTETNILYSEYDTNYEKLDGAQQILLDKYLSNNNFKCPFTMEVFKNPYLGKNGQNYEYEFVYNYKQSCGKNPIGVQNEDVDVDSLKPNQMLKDEIDTFLTDFNTNPEAFIERLRNPSANTSQNSRGDQVNDSSDDDLVVTIAGNVSGGGGNCFKPLGSCTEE